MTPAVRYPANAITPRGVYEMLDGRIPHVTYRAYDDTAVFNLMGPLAIYDPTQPEAVVLKSLKGLIPGWKAIEQKGATQDGSTFVTALYDTNEIDLTVEARGRNAEMTRAVVRDWIAAWDAKQPGELSFFTPHLGRWWAKVRWAKNPVDKIGGGAFTRQEFTWTAKMYEPFYQSYDDTAQLRFAYQQVIDYFQYTTVSELSEDWTVVYSGAGSGDIHVDNSEVISTLADGRAAVCRHDGFLAATNDQVVELQMGRFPSSWFHPTNTYIDMWARMANTGTAGDTGVRCRIGHSQIRLSYFIDGVETVIRTQNLSIPVQTGEKFMFVCGRETNTRSYQFLRNGTTAMVAVESGTSSPHGADYRRTGFGIAANGSDTAATVRAWAADDNNTILQAGFLPRTNVGDQPRFDRYTCIGPGTFWFTNGPGSSEVVEFGPLLPGQVVQIRTDPRVRSVVDLTSRAPTMQERVLWSKAIQDYASYATGNNVPLALQQIESMFSVVPPQGNLYRLLHGRFSDDAAIPAKPAGLAAPTYHVRVGIEDGTSDSQIICAGTPLRRFPY